MRTFQSTSVSPDKTVRVLGWVLGGLLLLKSLEFFLSIPLTTRSEFSPFILELFFFSISGVAMLLLALGTIQLARWVRIPLYVVFIANILFIIYSTMLVPNVVDAGFSLISTVILFVYLKKTRGLITGNRWLGLQILTILTLLPATLLVALSVLFPDEALQDDAALRLESVATISDEENLYFTLTSLGKTLPETSEVADSLMIDYPANWNQAIANQLLPQLQPQINAYLVATDQAYQCPTSVNNFSFDAELCQLNLLRDYANIMKFAALAEAGRGNVTRAQAYATAPITVGQTMMYSDNVTLIEYLVGLASVTIALDTFEILLAQNYLSPLVVQQQLADLTISPGSLRTPLQREYLGLRNTLDKKLIAPQTYFYHPNRTRNELFDFMSVVVKNGTRNCDIDNTDQSAMTDQATLDYIVDLRARATNPAHPNMIGDMYLSVVVASLNSVRKKVCETNDRLDSLSN